MTNKHDAEYFGKKYNAYYLYISHLVNTGTFTDLTSAPADKYIKLNRPN
jgi:hypothetical protein